MTDLLTPALAVAAVKFKWQKDEKTYDYFIPAGMEIAPGAKVIVTTARGETEVEVIAIKSESEMAAKPIVRIAEPKPEPQQATGKQDWNF